MRGPTPPMAKAILASKRVTNVEVARGYGCSVQYVGRVLNGYEPPSRRFRTFLSEYLDVDEKVLWDDPTPSTWRDTSEISAGAS
jgi:transcriptional regulator with XRE-family HTH domain